MHIDEHEFVCIEFVSPHNHFRTDCSVGIPKRTSSLNWEELQRITFISSSQKEQWAQHYYATMSSACAQCEQLRRAASAPSVRGQRAAVTAWAKSRHLSVWVHIYFYERQFKLSPRRFTPRLYAFALSLKHRSRTTVFKTMYSCIKGGAYWSE